MSKLDKAVKHLGPKRVEELEALNPGELEQHIVQAEKSMSAAHEELEANPKYQDLKEQLSACTQGKKDVNKQQKAVISVCLALLESKGRA